MPTLSEEGAENGAAQTPQPPKVYKKRGRKSKAELLAMRLEQGLPETPEPVPKQLEEEVIDEKEMTLGGRPKRRAAKAHGYTGLLAMRLEQGLPETPEPVPKQLEEEVIDEKEMTLGGRPKRRAAKAWRCVPVVCLPAMAKQSHGEYQCYGTMVQTVALAGASNNNENRRRKKKRK
ncbi:UNVERIFIED_CONTAM: hypothetical protein FKN15_018388 [Acipenser sinensis]